MGGRTHTSSLYTSTYSQLIPEFHTTQLIYTLGLNLFVAGLGTGPMVLSPLSEVRKRALLSPLVACVYKEHGGFQCSRAHPPLPPSHGEIMLIGTQFYGRRPIYICSFTFFLIFMIPCAVARNIQSILMARFLDGLAGSAFLSVAGGTVGDMFAKHVSLLMHARTDRSSARGELLANRILPLCRNSSCL
jgi:MFS family permease